MSSARYAPLPNPRLGGPDADREILDAFELDKDDEDATEETRLTSSYDTSPEHHAAASNTPATPGTYDFEREYDYDYPPPGSPPDPSAAIPNNYGNTNGVLPEAPARPVASRPSLFRRLAGALLPQHYQMVPTEPTHAVGGGIENDGVFANVMAKPGRAVAIRSESGDVFMVPEETQSQAPPVSIFYLRRICSCGINLTCASIKVLRRGASRRSSTILGDNCTCTLQPGSKRRHDRRRFADRFLVPVPGQHLHLLFLPIRGFPLHISSAFIACCKVWVPRRIGSYPDPVRVLLETAICRRYWGGRGDRTVVERDDRHDNRDGDDDGILRP